MTDRLSTILRSQPISANVRREVICIALAAAEVCWLAPVFLALGRVTQPHPAMLLWLGLLVHMLGFFYLYRALQETKLSPRWRQTLLVAALLLSIVLVLRYHVYAGDGLCGAEWFLQMIRLLAEETAVMPAGLVAIFFIVYLWARGVHLANRSLYADSVGFSFRAGLVALILIAFLVSVMADVDASGFGVLYFFFALVAVALARIEEVSNLPNSSRVPFSGFWIGSTVAAVMLLVFVGTVVAFFFYGGGLQRILDWLSPVFFVIRLLLVLAGVLLLALLEALLSFFSFDISVLGQAFREILRNLGELLVPPPASPTPDSGAQSRPAILGVLQVVLTIAIPAAIVILVVLITWYRARRAQREEEDEAGRPANHGCPSALGHMRTRIADGDVACHDVRRNADFGRGSSWLRNGWRRLSWRTRALTYLLPCSWS